MLALVAMLAVVAACNNSTIPGTPDVVCNSPYIRVGTECCLDQNDNNICDLDEAPPINPSDNDTTDTVVLPPEERCAEMDFQVESVCSVGPAVQYYIIVGDVPINNFTIEIMHSSYNSTKETSTIKTVRGGSEKSVVNGQVRLDPRIYSKAIVTSVPCNITKVYGPGFPGILPSC